MYIHETPSSDELYRSVASLLRTPPDELKRADRLMQIAAACFFAQNAPELKIGSPEHDADLLMHGILKASLPFLKSVYENGKKAERNMALEALFTLYARFPEYPDRTAAADAVRILDNDPETVLHGLTGPNANRYWYYLVTRERYPRDTWNFSASPQSIATGVLEGTIPADLSACLEPAPFYHHKLSHFREKPYHLTALLLGFTPEEATELVASWTSRFTKADVALEEYAVPNLLELIRLWKTDRSAPTRLFRTHGIALPLLYGQEAIRRQLSEPNCRQPQMLLIVSRHDNNAANDWLKEAMPECSANCTTNGTGLDIISFAGGEELIELLSQRIRQDRTYGTMMLIVHSSKGELLLRYGRDFDVHTPTSDETFADVSGNQFLPKKQFEEKIVPLFRQLISPGANVLLHTCDASQFDLPGIPMQVF